MSNKPLLVDEIIKKVRNETLDAPMVVSDYIDKLSASIWEIGQAQIKSNIAYAIKWKDIRKHTSSDKQADMEIQITDEYKLREECKYAEKTVIEVIRSLKKRLAILSAEFGSSTY